jgi:Ca2+-transporting ATPase
MILIDDNFASIVKGVEEGRTVYDNSKKAAKFLLASNFDGLMLITYSILMRLPLPLLPLQILWINLITDSFPALALTKEKGEEVMRSKPRKEKSLLNGIFWFVLIAAFIAFLAELILFHYSLNHFSIKKMRTIMTMTFIGFEALFVFVCRSEKSLKDIGLFSNKWIIYALVIVILLQVVLIYTPLAPLFSIVPLTLREWGLVFVASLPGLVTFEIWKLVRKRQGKRKKSPNLYKYNLLS